MSKAETEMLLAAIQSALCYGDVARAQQLVDAGLIMSKSPTPENWHAVQLAAGWIPGKTK